MPADDRLIETTILDAGMAAVQGKIVPGIGKETPAANSSDSLQTHQTHLL